VSHNSVELTKIALQSDWILPDMRNNRTIKLGDLERKLIACMAPKQIRKLLVELAKLNTNTQQPLWAINKNWFIPSDIRITILNLKRGFLQDFSYILLGKVNEMVQKKDYVTATALLTEVRGESKRPEWSNDAVVNKLGKLIDWEKINIQIISRLETFWPKKPPTIKDPWSGKLKQMVLGINNEMPRLEIIENSLLMLLNMNDWASCVFPEPKISLTVELCSIFALMMHDMQTDAKNKNPVPRKREFWDFILPIFSNSNQQQQNQNQKRNQHNRRSSDSPARFSSTMMNLSVFKQFLSQMRDPFVITILLSMLSKMHNLLKDDSNMELNIENLHLWPLSISNVNGYNIKSLAEALNQLLKLGLKLYPMNIPWIKLQGDLEFVNGNNEAAMKYYVQSIVIATEYCSLPIHRPLVDENIIKKMVKCSSNLGCFLQSAVLCQFMEEIDYTQAFKCLQEKSGNFQDAMDSYYSLIWDSTLLEYIINLHYKKGEHKRRLQAISFIRQLELNANNNEDIKQRAAAIRKIKFIRSLANQYM
jgi:integrator complex subunit 8